jgi:hypothetical protein
MKRAIILVIAVSLLSLPISGCLTSQIAGFTEADLNAPIIEFAENVPPSLPSPLSGDRPSFNYSLEWMMTEVFVHFGGAMNLSVRNTGNREMFIYGYGLKWSSSTEVWSRDTEAYVHPDQRVALGLLTFPGPRNAGSILYSIVLKAAVRTTSGSDWHDYGNLTAADRMTDVKELAHDQSYTVQKNNKDYYNRVNSRINFTAVEDVVGEIQAAYPGAYNSLQIAQAYEWVYSNIKYAEDSDGDYWQSTTETLSLGEGDCEDHAILMASIIGALGGNARVNVISEHAFPTVYVGNDSSYLVPLRTSLNSYYGTEFQICFLQDSLGFWLVVDTTGFPYAGGLPSLSSPTIDSHTLVTWTFNDSDWLITVDATGETVTDSGIF